MKEQFVGIVGCVHPDAGGLAVLEHPPVHRCVVGRGDDELVAVDVAGSVLAALHADAELLDGVGDVWGDDIDERLAVQQPADLLRCHPSSADDEAAPARHPEVDRVQRAPQRASCSSSPLRWR